MAPKNAQTRRVVCKHIPVCPSGYCVSIFNMSTLHRRVPRGLRADLTRQLLDVHGCGPEPLCVEERIADIT